MEQIKVYSITTLNLFYYIRPGGCKREKGDGGGEGDIKGGGMEEGRGWAGNLASAMVLLCSLACCFMVMYCSCPVVVLSCSWAHRVSMSHHVCWHVALWLCVVVSGSWCRCVVVSLCGCGIVALLCCAVTY
jgi:hypothetical protein